MLENWTSEDVQRDPEGFKRAQEQERGRAERERKEREEQDDFQRFAEMFVERGGDPSKSREMYSKYRNDKALEEAARLDKLVRQEMRAGRTRGV
jgi:hypothetical protein